MFAVELKFPDDLHSFLLREWCVGAGLSIWPVQSEKGDRQDVIAACDVPHLGVDLIVMANQRDAANPRAVKFAWQV